MPNQDPTNGNKIDLEALEARLSGDASKTFWRGLDQLSGTQEYLDYLHHEFPHDPQKEATGFSRRDVLKLMAASAALAGLTGCTKLPTEKIVPYVRPPEQIIPGKPLFYATSMTTSGVATGLLVESHSGRPTKVEGNPMHPGSLGATDVFAQASVLTLYDPDRSSTVVHEGRISDWPAFVRAATAIRTEQGLKKGAGLRILTETVTSPSLASQIHDLLQSFPEVRWYQWEPCGRDAAYQGALTAFGKPVNTVYRFDRADVVVSLGADLLCTGPGNLRYARDFSDRRRVTGPSSTMNRLYVVESTPSSTGTLADHRFVARADNMELLAASLAASLGLPGVTGDVSGPWSSWLPAVSQDLQRHRGSSLVVAGQEQSPFVHALAHSLNSALGNVDQSVVYTAPLEAEPTDQANSLRQLVDEMKAGQVDALLIIGANPVFAAPADLDFAQALLSVKQRIHMSLYLDETAELCHWHIPETHYLEAWGDARAFDGTVGVIQPLIAPLYQGKSPYELIAAFTGQSQRAGHDIIREYWMKQRAEGEGFDVFWDTTLHDGVMADSALPSVPAPLRPDLLRQRQTVPASQQVEIVFRPDPTIGDGRFANNGWLQELPKPITKLTWDNAAILSPATARRLNLSNGDLVKLTAANRSVQAPAWIQPGQADESVTLHLGYGRRRAGKVGTGIGVNAYALRAAGQPWFVTGASIEKSQGTYPLATTQHHSIIGDKDQTEEESTAAFQRDLVRIATLGEFRKNPGFAQLPDDQPANALSLYPGYRYDGYAWAMSIDLNSCTGCGACVIACQAENNIAVVGKEEVLRGREMHWIRVDTYYRGGLQNPEMYHEPVPCMQCENAPCEVVCPVGATVHSPEGLNDMVYNRCVGTRYCSNNCPYKVRRFNFKLYSDWTTESLFGVRNPNVTVRSRGVMEKCTYCVQRINAAKIRSEEEDRTVRDGEIVTACQSACPTQAIIFGNQNDPNSKVAQLKAQTRNYSLLADLNTRPRTTYLARLRNPNPEIHA